MPTQERSSAIDCCPGVPTGLNVPVAERLAPIFKALGDPVRLRLLSLIAAGDETCVCELTPLFSQSDATISHHLKVLRNAGLVSAVRRGTWVYYSARAQGVELLRSVGS